MKGLLPGDGILLEVGKGGLKRGLADTKIAAGTSRASTSSPRHVERRRLWRRKDVVRL